MPTALRVAKSATAPNASYTTLSAEGTLGTPRQRMLGVQWDGLPSMSGTYIGPAVTNKVTQPTPGAAATTGVTFTNANNTLGALTIPVDATAPFQGTNTKVWLLDNSLGDTDATVEFDGVASAAAHVGSIWALKVAGSPTLKVAAAGSVAIASTTVYANYSTAVTAGAGDKLRITAPAGAIVRFTAGQLETGAVRSPFTPTSRAAGRIQVPNPIGGQLITAGAGALAMRPSLGWSQADGITGYPVLWDWRDDANNDLQIVHLDADNNFSFYRAGGGVAAAAQVVTTHTKNVPFSITTMWSPSTLYASMNGGTFVSQAQSDVPNIAATMITLGSVGTGNQMMGNAILAVFWNAKSDLAAVQNNPAFINQLLTQGVTDLDAYPGYASGLFDGNHPEYVMVR